MVVWQRHLQSIVRQAAKRVEHNCNVVAKFSTSGFESVTSHGEAMCLQKVWKQPSAPRPLYQYLQQMGISTSRRLQAESTEDTPVSSPLSKPVLAIDSGETKSLKPKPETVQAVLKKIKQSPRKVNLVAEMVRGMRVEDALLQLQVTVKRAAQTVYKVIHSARANATHNHGLDPDRLLVAEAFLGKGKYLKRINYHSKKRCGVRIVPECRLTVVLREITPEEEAKIAKLKVHSCRKFTKDERRLVPHKLIETTPIWDRKAKSKRGNEHNDSM